MTYYCTAPHTVLAPTIGILWQTLSSEGIDPAPLFREFGIEQIVMRDSLVRMLEMTTRNLWRRAIDATGDDCLGIKAGRHWHPSQLGALGWAWLASPTLRTALERAARYMQVLNDTRELRLEETPAGFVCTLLSKSSADELSINDDVHLSMLIEMCRANYGRQLNPVAVTFTHPRPKCAGEYFAHFLCPVEFDAREISLTLPMGVVDQPLLGDNPMLAKLSDQVMIEHLAQLDQKQFTERVKALIIDQLPSGGACMQKIGDLLAVSPRTLERRLKKEKTSFTRLMEGIRRDLAIRYLRDGSLSRMEIAFLLGFSEESAFSRAFKRWTGCSPGKYIQEQEVLARVEITS